MNNAIILNDFHKSEAFNNYLAIDANAAIDEPIITTDYELFNITGTCQDIKDVLQNLKLDKAFGFHMINHRLLKESVNMISKPLTSICNRSLKLGIFPNTHVLNLYMNTYAYI